jgi:hypothetical protein
MLVYLIIYSVFNYSYSSLDYIVSNKRMIREWWIGEDMKGSDNFLFKVSFRHLSEGIDKNHEKPLSK